MVAIGIRPLSISSGIDKPAPGHRNGGRTFCFCGWLAAVVWLLSLPTARVTAQVILPNRSSEELDEGFQVLMHAPREYKQLLKEAEEDLGAERFSEAIEKLARIIHGSGPGDEALEEDYFLDEPTGSESLVERSLKTESLRLLGSMPARGLELYELQYGAEARRRLDQAMETGDEAALETVARQFFHTQAGYQAMLLLARHYLDTGRPLAAAVSCAQLSAAPAAVAQFEPQLSMLAAISWHMAGAEPRVDQALSRISQWPSRSGLASSLPPSLLAGPGEARAWLEAVTQPYRASLRRVAQQWTVHRGNAARNASSAGSWPLLQLRWRVPIANDPFDESLIRSMAEAFRQRRVPSIPAAHPLIVQDFALFRSVDTLLGVDLKTGKRVWEFPWSGSLGDSQSPLVERGAQRSVEIRQHQLEERVWQDAIYGQLSSDGERVYLIDELGYASSSSSEGEVRILPGAIRLRNPDQPWDANVLIALELASEGKFLWKIGGETGGDEPAVAGVFFLGPPLPVANDLFVIGEVRGDTSLFVLDPRSGHLKWSQQLAHVEELTILVDTDRRLAGASPSYQDGMVVCPTSAGAVVAVDAVHRSLLWGREYTRQWSPYVGHMMRIQRRGLPDPQLGSTTRWIDATVTLAEGRVVVTPVESDEILCLDLLTGKTLWGPVKRGDWLYVACVQDGKIMLVGMDEVTALGLDDGTSVWTRRYRDSDDTGAPGPVPSGRGFLSGFDYFLPLTDRLIQLDVRSGDIVRSVRTEPPLGNLVAYRDQVVSLGTDWLSSFCRADVLEQLVNQRLAQDAHDAWALEQRGLLRLDSGNATEAIRDLREAVDRYAVTDARRDRAKAVLVDTLLAVLQRDPAANEPVAREIDQLIDRPDQRQRYLRLMAEGYLESGKPAQAFSAFMELAAFGPAQLIGAGRTPDDPAGLEVKEPDRLSVRYDRLVRAGIMQAIDAATGDDLEAMERAVRLRAEQACHSGDVAQMRWVLDILGFHPATDAVRLELAQRLALSREWLAAQLVLLPLVQRSTLDDSTLTTEHRASSQLPDPSADATAVGAVLLLAQILHQAGDTQSAASLYRHAHSRWPDALGPDGRTVRQILAAIDPQSELGRATLQSPEWPFGRVELSVQPMEPRSMSSRLHTYPASVPLPLQAPHQLGQPELDIFYDLTGSELVARNELGNDVTRIGIDRNQGGRLYALNGGVHFLGHLLIASLGSEVMAVDLLTPAAQDDQQRILWPGSSRQAVQTNLQQRYINARSTLYTNAWGQTLARPTGTDFVSVATVTAEGVVYRQGTQLQCVDPLTGQTIWARPDVPADADAWGDAEMVLVAAQRSTQARVFRTRDGVELGQREVPAAILRWTTVGRFVLTWSDTSEGDQPVRTLKLYDPWTDANVWQHDFTQQAKGYVVQDGCVGVVEPDGRFVYVDLATGKRLIDQRIRMPEREVREIYVLTSQRRVWLVCGQRDPQVRAGLTINTLPDATFAPLVDGHVYAFDRATGTSLWQAPAVIEGYGLPLNQPAEVPVLLFVRQEFRTDPRTRGNRPQVSVLCIDRRDGHVLLEKNGLDFNLAAYAVEGDRARHLVRLDLPDRKTYTLQFTDEQRAPEPPAQTGSASSLAAGRRNVVTTVGEAIVAALRREAQDQSRQTQQQLERFWEQVEHHSASQSDE